MIYTKPIWYFEPSHEHFITKIKTGRQLYRLTLIHVPTGLLLNRSAIYINVYLLFLFFFSLHKIVSPLVCLSFAVAFYRRAFNPSRYAFSRHLSWLNHYFSVPPHLLVLYLLKLLFVGVLQILLQFWAFSILFVRGSEYLSNFHWISISRFVESILIQFCFLSIIAKTP